MTDEERITDLEQKNKTMAAALCLFADPGNWKNDRTWKPVAVVVERQYPDVMAAKTLEKCGVLWNSK